MDGFKNFKSVSKLLKCEPYDLTKEGAISEERINTFKSENLGFKLFYATERVDEKILALLFELAGESRAIEKMQEMQSGSIINASEKRAVLHTAMRDFSKRSEMAKKAFVEIEKLRKFLATSKFESIVQIGIGGSDLGPRAIYKAMRAFATKKAKFISNVDPDDVFGVLKKVDLKKTLFISVSKSGTTLETLTNEAIVREELKKAGLNPKDHIVAVTGEKSPMDDPSKYLESFYIWDSVGGRFSVSSMVGGVMLASVMGMENYLEFLKGAHEMDKVALLKENNLPLIAALIGIWNRNFLNLPTLAVIPYSKALSKFTAHLQQCDMESNGKSVTREGKLVDFKTGPIVWGEIGTDGQHSFFQFLHQGSDIASVEFIGFANSQLKEDLKVEGTTSQEKLLSNLFAQNLAFAIGQKSENPNKYFPGNRPSSILMGRRLDPFTMGALLAYYEHKVAFQGFIWGVNSFDQEGVQLGKSLATKFLDCYKGKPFPLGKLIRDCLKIR